MNAVAQQVEHLPLAPAPSVAASPMLSLLSDAIQRGMDIEVIRELKTLAKEMAADDARRAFDAAMSDAKADIPVIIKNKLVDFPSKGEGGNGRTTYRHEDLGQIARTIDPILAKHGLSYRFRTTSELGQPVSVTCIVAHRAGHSEENTLFAGRDDSGKKNSIQQIGSTITYLQRYTLKAALGLAAGHDDDGALADDTDDGELITAEQRDHILKLIDEVGGSVPVFCKYFKIESVAALPASEYARAVAAAEAKRGK